MRTKVVLLTHLNQSIPYEQSLLLQRQHQFHLINNKQQPQNTTKGTVILLEHLPVFTLGKGSSSEKNLLDRNIQSVRVERGGEITYHGPGQLVGYFVLDLEYFVKDLHWMVRSVEEVCIQTLRTFGIKGERMIGKSGVWVDGGYKLASVGLGCKQWVTIHGFGLNVTEESLLGFQKIIPCGISSTQGTVSCMASFVNKNNPPKMERVYPVVIDSIQRVFNIDFQNSE